MSEELSQLLNELKGDINDDDTKTSLLNIQKMLSSDFIQDKVKPNLPLESFKKIKKKLVPATFSTRRILQNNPNTVNIRFNKTPNISKKKFPQNDVGKPPIPYRSNNQKLQNQSPSKNIKSYSISPLKRHNSFDTKNENQKSTYPYQQKQTPRPLLTRFPSKPRTDQKFHKSISLDDVTRLNQRPKTFQVSNNRDIPKLEKNEIKQLSKLNISFNQQQQTRFNDLQPSKKFKKKKGLFNVFSSFSDTTDPLLEEKLRQEEYSSANKRMTVSKVNRIVIPTTTSVNTVNNNLDLITCNIDLLPQIVHSIFCKKYTTKKKKIIWKLDFFKKQLHLIIKQNLKKVIDINDILLCERQYNLKTKINNKICIKFKNKIKNEIVELKDVLEREEMLCSLKMLCGEIIMSQTIFNKLISTGEKLNRKDHFKVMFRGIINVNNIPYNGETVLRITDEAKEKIKVVGMTWNMMKFKPYNLKIGNNLDSFKKSFELSNGNGKDIYIITLQNVPDNYASTGFFSTVIGNGYECVFVNKFFGCQTLVFVKFRFKKRIFNFQVINKKLSPSLKFKKNVNSVGVSVVGFSVDLTKFLVFNVCLAAVKNGRKKNQNLKDILSCVKFKKNETDLFSGYHYQFLMGNFNYPSTKSYSIHTPVDEYALSDTLLKEMKNNGVISGFQENEINFKPKIDVSCKLVSFPNRIFYNFREEDFKVEKYKKANDITSSPDKPVFCSFNINITRPFCYSFDEQKARKFNIVFNYLEFVDEISILSGGYVQFCAQFFSKIYETKVIKRFDNMKIWSKSDIPRIEPKILNKQYLQERGIVIYLRSVKGLFLGSAYLGLKDVIIDEEDEGYPVNFLVVVRLNGQRVGILKGEFLTSYEEEEEESGDFCF